MVKRLWIGMVLVSIIIPGVVHAEELKPDPFKALNRLPYGVLYDPDPSSWYFYGVPYETVHYEIPGGAVDLVHVYFLDEDGTSRQVWVSLGGELLAPVNHKQRGLYISRGPWQDADQARDRVVLSETIIKVSIGGSEAHIPQVSQQGVDWSTCVEGDCIYGKLFDEMHNDLSNWFIQTSVAPSWYPWGFLFWKIELVELPGVQFKMPHVLSKETIQ